MKKDKLFRSLSVLTMLALAFVFAFGLVACGAQSEEDKVEAMVKSEFSSIKKMNEDDLKELVGDTSKLEAYGIDPMELWNAMFSKFDYEVTNVTLNDKKDEGEVALTVHHIDISTAMSTWYKWITDFANSEEGSQAFSSSSEEELMKMIAGKLIEELGSEDLETVERSVSVAVKKDGDNWTLADKNAAFSALFGGTDPSAVLGVVG